MFEKKFIEPIVCFIMMTGSFVFMSPLAKADSMTNDDSRKELELIDRKITNNLDGEKASQQNIISAVNELSVEDKQALSDACLEAIQQQIPDDGDSVQAKNIGAHFTVVSQSSDT